MENRMHARHIRRQIQFVRNFANPVQDSEWTHIFGEEFARSRIRDPEIFGAQEYASTDLKIGLIATLISIELLTLLSGVDLLLSIHQECVHPLNKVLSTRNRGVSTAALHDCSWNPRMPSVIQEERAVSRRCRFGIVIGEFRRCETLIPIVHVGRDVDTQHLLESAIGTLGLPV